MKMKKSVVMMSLFFLSACGGGGGGHSGAENVSSVASTAEVKGGVTEDSGSAGGSNPDKGQAPGDNGNKVTVPGEKPGEGTPVPPAGSGEALTEGGGNGKAPEETEVKDDNIQVPGENGGEVVAPGEKPEHPPADKIPDEAKPADKAARYEGRIVEYTGTGKGNLSDSSLSATKQDTVITANGDYFVFSVDGTNVNVVANTEMLPDMESIKLSTTYPPDINVFVDQETKKLIGFYGQAVGSMVGRDNITGDNDTYNVSSMAYFADENMKKQPEVDATYYGRFLYYYRDTPNTAVAAIEYKDKKIAGHIHNSTSKQHWDIDKNNIVNEDGSFLIRLISDDTTNTSHGSLNGGFYGSQGEFLVGEAKSDNPDDSRKHWHGVIGASKEGIQPQ
ncbi:hypothetical protein NF634_004555 [Salmonella enterica]|nr:hypothetical protein [Salmonella enterica]